MFFYRYVFEYKLSAVLLFCYFIVEVEHICTPFIVARPSLVVLACFGRSVFNLFIVANVNRIVIDFSHFISLA